MGWQTSALFIQIDPPADMPGMLHELGILEDAEVGDDVDFLTASSSTEFEQVFVGAAGGWTIVCGMAVLLALGQQEYSRKAKIVEMVLGGASSTYHYAVYTDGVELRVFTEQEGEVKHSRGAPLPQEADLDAYTYSEARVLEIVQRCTLPLSAYEDITFRCFIGQPNFG